MIIQVVYLATRYFLGLLFLATSIGKLLDNRGFAEVIGTYQLGIPDGVLLPAALGVSLLELGIGLHILLGRALRLSVLGTLCFHVGYTTLAVVTLHRDIPIANCGCFGVFLARPLAWSTVIEDAVLVAISVVCLLLVNKKRWQRP